MVKKQRKMPSFAQTTNYMSITLVIVVMTCLISYQGFNNAEFFNQLKFWPFVVKREKEYYRFLTSGFLHGSWTHLLVNMFVLYSFGSVIEEYFNIMFGPLKGRIFYLLLYLLAVVASDLPTYAKRKDTPYYASIGASGAVSALLFAYILIAPWSQMLLYAIIPVYSIIAGVAYLFYSSWASRNAADNVNHDAHFYGAVFGFLFTIVLKPSLFTSFLEQLMQPPFLH
jgi:membrane associated rhomboid family serine protease